MMGRQFGSGCWKLGVRISVILVLVSGVVAVSCASGGDDAESPKHPIESVAASAPTLGDDAALFAKNLEKATAGDALAQHNAGVAYLRGDGVGKNLSEAVTWLQLAAGQGAPQSQFSLGVLYEDGRGVKQDATAAAGWYQAAAEQGHADAQFNLGGLYLNGDGVARNEARAAYWYRRAANRGLTDAQFLLGGMYRAGLGVKRDEAAAAYWFQQAARSEGKAPDAKD